MGVTDFGRGNKAITYRASGVEYEIAFFRGADGWHLHLSNNSVCVITLYVLRFTVSICMRRRLRLVIYVLVGVDGKDGE